MHHVVGEIRVAGVAAAVHDRHGHAVPGEAGGAWHGGPHGVGGGGIEQSDRLVGIDVLGEPGGDGGLHRRHRAVDHRERHVAQRLHREAEPLEGRDLARARGGLEGRDAAGQRRPVVGGEQAAEAGEVEAVLRLGWRGGENEQADGKDPEDPMPGASRNRAHGCLLSFFVIIPSAPCAPR